jgi:PAS domain S-box-containing protein
MNNHLAEIIFNSISDGVFTVDEKCIITSFNRAAEAITGFSAREAVGKYCFEIFRTEICHKHCALRDTLANHDPVENIQVTIITKEGCEIPVSVSTTLLRDDRGRVVGAVEFFRDLTEVEQLRTRVAKTKAVDNIISASPFMRRIIQMLPDIAESECNVLIHGPSGSGKELIAEAIHNLSPRRYGSYIRLNCAALPATLLESELFGYAKGAFTDAKRNKPGQFCLANGGTLLLDEIGEMDMALQVKLLRVLNNGEYQPLGDKKMQRTNARVIAATNANLREAIDKGTFREDLFFRLNVVSIALPPLRERPEDIPLLVEHFIGRFAKKSRKPIHSLSTNAMAVLLNYPFPGNVRELENAIEHAFVMCHGDQMEKEHLPFHILEHVEMNNGERRQPKNETQLIKDSLRRHRGNRSRVADELGMHRSTLWRKIKTYGLG